ncbi:hypothetical protein [Geotalea toluenoxydans]
MPIKDDEKLEVWSQQVLLPDTSVYSKQWLQIEHEVSNLPGFPPELLDLYLSHIRRCTLTLVRPAKVNGGIHFRLLGSSLSLLSFSPPEIKGDTESYDATLCLCGGFLVQQGECERGRFRLTAKRSDGGVTLSVELSDYCPLLLGSSRPSRLRKVSYKLTQAYIHKAVTIRFLAGLCRKLTGRSLPVKVRTQSLNGGEEI